MLNGTLARIILVEAVGLRSKILTMPLNVIIAVCGFTYNAKD
jgi:hypothetical protein